MGMELKWVFPGQHQPVY